MLEGNLWVLTGVYEGVVHIGTPCDPHGPIMLLPSSPAPSEQAVAGACMNV